MNRSQRPSKDELRDLYVTQLLVSRTIANRYGVSKETVLQWLNEEGIPRRRRNRDGWTLVSRERLAELWNADHSIPDLSKMLGVSESSLKRYALHYKLPGKPTGPKSKLRDPSPPRVRTVPVALSMPRLDRELVTYLETVPDGSFGGVLALIPANAGSAEVVASHLARIARDSIQLVVVDAVVDPWIDVLEQHGWTTRYELCGDTWPVLVAIRQPGTPGLPVEDEADLDAILTTLLKNVGPGPILVTHADRTSYVGIRSIGARKQTTVLLIGKRGISKFLCELAGNKRIPLTQEEQNELNQLIANAAPSVEMEVDKRIIGYSYHRKAESRAVRGADGESSLAQQYHLVGETNAD